MNILVVGSGGREHALVWKISQSPLVEQIYCAPGNGGTKELAINVDINVMEFEQLAEFAIQHKVELTIVGPDDPLVGGIVDVFSARGLKVFGPKKDAAMIEGSKVFSKKLMKKYGIPTAEYKVFDNVEDALDYIESTKYPMVIKADGLALGKGVLICNTKEQAREAIESIMIEKQFGDAGNQIIIEEFMEGREVSVLAFCDGNIIKPMASAQDHKRAKDNDEGLNTGGMGAFSPSPFYNREVEEFCVQTIYQKTMDAMKAEGREFVGILFVGLMLTKDGPKVLEYNARFGDPETQVVLPRMKQDIIPLVLHCIEGTLDEVELEFSEDACVSVVLASDGYPISYEKGYIISGLDKIKEEPSVITFHAGTTSVGNDILTSGGRVLSISGVGSNLIEARKVAYEATKLIEFENKFMRTDIGSSITFVG